MHCSDPDSFVGDCKHIKQCPSVLNDFITRSNESDYIAYLRQSNVNCHYMKPFVCCPHDGRQNSNLPETHFQRRLLSPEEGCGYSNNNIRIKFAGGHKAKVGES